MGSLAAALQRLQGRDATAEPYLDLYDDVPLPIAARGEDAETCAGAMLRLVPSPALIAVVSIGVTGDWLPTLRRLGVAVSARAASDVVLLGPGLLDDASRLAAQWTALRPRVGYGMVHASAERAMLRFEALRETAGVIAVVEMERTATHAVGVIRALLNEHGVPLLGTLVIRDE